MVARRRREAVVKLKITKPKQNKNNNNNKTNVKNLAIYSNSLS